MTAAQTIIVDLDGTLADIGHRRHHVEGKRKNWPAFFKKMHLDPLNVWCRELMVAMKQAGYRIAIVSGRPDSYEEVIRAWLLQHQVPFDALHMRREGDYCPDDIVKREILHAHFRKPDILFVVDDRESVVRMWRQEGLVCLQCNPDA
jgi:phosphoglycolate phosphatase-like HAD superfamily hydrolase